METHRHSLVVVDEMQAFDLKRRYCRTDDLLRRFANETIRKTNLHYSYEMDRGIVDSADVVVARSAKLLRVAVVAVADAEAVGQESAEQLSGSPIQLGLHSDTVAAKSQIMMEIHCQRHPYISAVS